MIEFLVRRERKLDVESDVAVRRLERLERGNIQLGDEKHEASLTEALADRTKVAKLVVDKWFFGFGFGFGFGKVQSGEVVFIHAVSSTRAWGRSVWKEERDKERAKQSGAASQTSSGVNSKPGSSVGEGSLRGASHRTQCEAAGHLQP